MKFDTRIIPYNGSRWIKKCVQSLIDTSVVTKIIISDLMMVIKTLSKNSIVNTNIIHG